MRTKFLLSLFCLAAATSCAAKDMKTLYLTTQPPMSCSNCENKIKKNIRFEKGIHQISTDLEGQVVTIAYDADKTDEEKILRAFDKIHYTAIILDDKTAPDPAEAVQAVGAACCK